MPMAFAIGFAEEQEVSTPAQTPVATLLGSLKQGGTGVGAFTNPSDSASFTNNRSSVYAVLVAFGTTSSGGGNELTAALTYGGQTLTQVASNKTNIDAMAPVVRIYRLSGAPTGSNVFSVSMTCAQDVNSWGVALFSVANDGGVGPNLLQQSGAGSSASQALTMSEIGSIAFGGWAVQGHDSLPFTQGTGYDEMIESDTVSSGAGSNSADMGWIVQSDDSTAVAAKTFDASWSTNDDYGVAAIEILKGGGSGGGGGVTVNFPGGSVVQFPSGANVEFPD